MLSIYQAEMAVSAEWRFIVSTWFDQNVVS
jgi:hypothetical protein